MAGLAYWHRKFKSQDFQIEPVGDDTRKLADQAENIICQGLALEPNPLPHSIDDLPEYSFDIHIKQSFKKERIFLVARDYPGEIFDAINSSDPRHSEYIEECFHPRVGGCLILLDRWEPKSDNYYAPLMEQFIQLRQSYQREDMRVAVALSKCERGELWSCRLDPERDIFDTHLHQTTKILKKGIASRQKLQFFAISTFGVLDPIRNPRPNRRDEVVSDEIWGERRSCYLRKPGAWRPYGMMAPIYWLAKEARMSSRD